MPPAADAPPPALAFGDFVLDIAQARLTRAGAELALSRKPFAFLAELALRPGELVSKDHLLDTVWQRRFVSDSAVKSVLSELRAVLGDDARSPRWIETVPARGYRFLGVVDRLRRDAPPGAADAPDGPGLLPRPATALIGREALLATLQAAARQSDATLLTLVGPAGVGKSLLALTLAHRLRAERPDGAGWVDLATLPAACDAQLLRAAVAQALRLADTAAADDASLARALQGLRLLLVLDNAEHVVDALAPLLASLLAQTAALQLWVTSREPLHLPMERVHPVPPLDLPDPAHDADPAHAARSGAARLFLARVRARLPQFELGDHQGPQLTALCRALDGLPLALELAAARVPTLGLDGLHRQLAPADADGALDADPARLRLLSTGSRGEPRHQTLRAALDWSHALLSAPQQQLLRRLALFRSHFTLVDAQQLAHDDTLDDWAVLDALEALVERSWVEASPGEPRRFRLLHGVRAYASARLLDAGELEPTRARHLQAVLQQWQRADARALGDPALQWVEQHQGALPDLRAALAWGCEAVCAQPPALAPDTLLALAGASALLWHRAGQATEGVRWCERVLALAGAGAAPAERAGVDLALAHLGGIAMVVSASQGLAAARRAAAGFAARGDTVREMYALYLQHTLMARAEPAADRTAVLQRLQALVQPDWGELLRRFARHAAAYEARLQGRHAEYLAFNQAELARCRACGAQWEAWSAGIGLMLAQHDAGQLARAVAIGREVLDEIRAAGRLRQNANRLAMWIMMLAEAGDTAATRQALDEALPILRGGGRSGMALLGAAWLALHEGRPAAAVRLLARFDAPGRTGAEFGPGTFIRRSVAQLWGRLRAALGDAAMAHEVAAAEGQSDAETLNALLGRAAAA